MAISTTQRKRICPGNGSATIFNFPFKVIEKSNFILIYTNTNGEHTILKQDTDYSLSNVGEDSGVTVTYPISTEVGKLQSGEKLTGYRETNITQLLDFMYDGGFSPRIHENAFDKVTMILQEFAEELDRRPMMPITSPDMNVETWLEEMQSKVIEAINISNQSYSKTQQLENTVSLLNSNLGLYQSDVIRIINFVNSITNKLDLEHGTLKFYEIAETLETKVATLTAKVEELTTALENKIDKDPIIQLITSTGEIITDSSETIINTQFRKEYYA